MPKHSFQRIQILPPTSSLFLRHQESLTRIGKPLAFRLGMPVLKVLWPPWDQGKERNRNYDCYCQGIPVPGDHWDTSFHWQEKLPGPGTSQQFPGTPGKTMNILVPRGGIPKPLPEACEGSLKQGERDDFVPSHTPWSVASGEGRGSAGSPKERVQTHPHPAHVAQFAFVSQRVLENLEREDEERRKRLVKGGSGVGQRRGCKRCTHLWNWYPEGQEMGAAAILCRSGQWPLWPRHLHFPHVGPRLPARPLQPQALTFGCPSRRSLWNTWQNFQQSTALLDRGSRLTTDQKVCAPFSWWVPSMHGEGGSWKTKACMGPAWARTLDGAGSRQPRGWCLIHGALSSRGRHL